jgi:hypothetical protein
MQSAAPNAREQQILMLWERGAGLNRWARDDALLAAIGVQSDRLGPRNSALLSLRSRLFDRPWPLKSCCPECGTECEFEADSSGLAEALLALPLAEEADVEINGQKIHLRVPTARDIRILSMKDRDGAVCALLGLCISPPCVPEYFDSDALVELSTHLERLDPGALVSFALSCPACHHAWSSDIDVGEAVWSEVQRAAERIFVEIDVLARAYGWTEADVLDMSAIRRAAYLQLAGIA